MVGLFSNLLENFLEVSKGNEWVGGMLVVVADLFQN